MLFKHAKLALITSLIAAANCEKTYGYRTGDAKITNEIQDEDLDFFRRNKDSSNPAWDDKKFSDTKKGKKLKKRLEMATKIIKNYKKNGKCEEKDFAKGVLVTFLSTLPEKPTDTLTVEEIVDTLANLLGKPDDATTMSKGVSRGMKFAHKKLASKVRGCHEECKGGVLDVNCVECCRSFDHSIDWQCGTEDAVSCCTEWSEECYFEKSEDNNQHGCMDCGYGYGGYGRSYGGYGGYSGGYDGGYGGGYGGYRGRR